MNKIQTYLVIIISTLTLPLALSTVALADNSNTNTNPIYAAEGAIKIYQKKGFLIENNNNIKEDYYWKEKNKEEGIFTAITTNEIKTILKKYYPDKTWKKTKENTWQTTDKTKTASSLDLIQKGGKIKL